jgi:hypothetical protein
MADRGSFPGHSVADAAARGFTATHGMIADAVDPTIPGDRAPLDAWGNPLVIVVLPLVIDGPAGTVAEDRAYLISAGPNQTIDFTVDETTRRLVPGDDQYLPLVTL